MDFRWIQWNIHHIAEHGITPEEAERVVTTAKPPYPEDIGEEKRIVLGRGQGERFIQVIYVIDPDSTIFIIHARSFTNQEKLRYRRRKR